LLTTSRSPAREQVVSTPQREFPRPRKTTPSMGADDHPRRQAYTCVHGEGLRNYGGCTKQDTADTCVAIGHSPSSYACHRRLTCPYDCTTAYSNPRWTRPASLEATRALW